MMTFPRSFTLALLGFGLAYLGFGWIADSQLAYDLSTEDGPFEMAGAFLFLLVAGVHGYLFWNSRTREEQFRIFPKRNPIFLALALLFFVAFGEEISWGQRMIGWETPEAVEAVNEQGETNLHNLKWFHSDNLLNMARLFGLFWLGYCVILPAVNRWVPPAKRMLHYFAVPVPAPWVAGVFLGCYIPFKVYTAVQGLDKPGDPNELKEAFIALCFVLLGMQQLRSQTRKRVAARRDLGGMTPLGSS